MFSIIIPMDWGRLEQFKQTKQAYDKMGHRKEFLIITRDYPKVIDYLLENKLMKNVTVIPYVHKVGFNPAKALNLGVKKSKYDQIIITSPEVKPKGKVLDQLKTLIGQNVICQVWDTDESGKVVASLVHRGYRSDTPAMYFLAMFNKKDIEAINGWDEEFMRGYGYEDNDFGDRWVRAGIPFVINEEIQGVHQYHPRLETIPGGLGVALNIYNQNNANGIVQCVKGLKVLK